MKTTALVPVDSRREFEGPEICRKIGCLVCSKVSFSGVPSGTLGIVRWTVPLSRCVTVEWLNEGRLFGPKIKVPVDWFSRREYYRFLIEVGKIN